MSIQIITIGDELLEGQILNTNAFFISKEFMNVGYQIERQLTVSDHPQAILEAFKDSFNHFTITITSGGLGPTLDDRTLEAACSLFDSTLQLDPHLLKKLQLRFKNLQPRHLEQSARVPKKAHIFSDHVGMVPGYVFKKGKKRLILLPGVPHEFQHLVIREVLPLLKKQYPITEKNFKKVIRFSRLPESELAPDLDRIKAKRPDIDFGVYPHFSFLSVHIKKRACSQSIANLEINAVLKELKNKYPQNYFEGKFESPEAALHHFLIIKGYSLSFAESCTGGALASKFTRLPDASKYFKGSIIAYQNEVKIEPLKVTEKTLREEGAVSAACAQEMALGALQLFKTDLAIATTGVAGPSGGTKKNPVGTVWIAFAFKNKIIFCQKFQFKGSRDVIIERTILNALAEFWMMRDNL